MAPRVLLLDNTLHPRLFILAKRWGRPLRGVAVDVVHAPSSRALPDVGGYTHLILTGSEASILAPAPWMEREARAVREAAAGGVRVLGSCFGHQMLVYALAGRRFLGRSARQEVGWTPIEILADDELLRGLPNPWTVFSFHFDEVVTPLPPPWRVLARTRDCAAQILRWGDSPVWGIQAHPEILRATAELATRAVLLAARHRGGMPRAALRRPHDGQVFFDLVGRFLGGEAGRSG
jgi:GMP synthase-like glutamine amidotransferase